MLSAPNATIPVSPEEGPWLATSVPLVSMFCTPLAALSVHVLGRKKALFISIIPFLLSWIGIAFARTSTELILARSISGLGMAFSYTVTPIYLGEIAPDEFRSSIGLFMTVVNNIGILWIYAIGTFVELWVSSLLCIAPIIIYLIFYKYVPESPYFLLKRKKNEEAKSILKKLRKGDVEEEFSIMEKSVIEVSFKESCKELFTDIRHRRALMISVGTFFVSQFTGGIAFLFYAHLIFQRAGNLSPNTLSLIKAVLQVLTSIFSAYIVESTGKRPLLIISTIGSSVFMAAEGIYFYLHDNDFNVDAIWWLPLAGMILFNMFQVIGLQSVPLAFLGELFDPNIKYIAVCVSKTSLALFVFIVGQLFELLVNNFGNCAPFFTFCIIGLLSLIFIVLCVPETRGRSLEDIQYYLKHKTYEREADKEENNQVTKF